MSKQLIEEIDRLAEQARPKAKIAAMTTYLDRLLIQLEGDLSEDDRCMILKQSEMDAFDKLWELLPALRNLAVAGMELAEAVEANECECVPMLPTCWRCERLADYRKQIL